MTRASKPGSTPAELVALGMAFKSLTGRQPARDDFVGEAKRSWETKLGFDLPVLNHITRAFGSWSAYLTACGFDQNDQFKIQGVERAAVDHCKASLGFTEEDYERSITDGWMPDGTTAEVKGATLHQHKTLGVHYFAWRIHGRELSASADHLLLVGVGKDKTPLIRLEIPKSALASVADGKSNLTLYTSSVWGGGQSKLRRFVRWAVRMPEAELIRRYADVKEAKETSAPEQDPS